MIDLQPDHRPIILAIHLENFISRPDWIPQNSRRKVCNETLPTRGQICNARWCVESLETPVSQKRFSQFLFKSAGKYGLIFSKHIGGEYRGYKGVSVRPDCALS